MVCHEDVFDVIRMIEEECFLRTDLEVRDITILLSKVLKIREWAVPISEQAGKGYSSLRTGRVGTGWELSGHESRLQCRGRNVERLVNIFNIYGPQTPAQKLQKSIGQYSLARRQSVW